MLRSLLPFNAGLFVALWFPKKRFPMAAGLKMLFLTLDFEFLEDVLFYLIAEEVVQNLSDNAKFG
jgi:hypothetical protein